MQLLSLKDKVLKFINTQTKCFSMLMLAGSLNLSVTEVRCFPVPWVPGGVRATTGNAVDGITFGNLPPEGEIAIYTVSGNMINKISFQDSITGEIQWFGKNDEGQDVASGVYLWVVKSSVGKKTGKLIIVR